LGLLGTRDSVPESLAVADFQQTGRYSVFVVASDGSSLGRAYFLSQSGSTWTDISGTLFASTAAREACVRPQQALVADLNGDGRPDVYLACAGDTNGSSLVRAPQYLYISRSDGGYDMRKATDINSNNISLHSTGAAMGDINADGIPDVVSTDNGSLVVMLGERSSGQYLLRFDNARLPNTPPLPSGIRSVFLLPRNSATGGSGSNTTRYDLLVGGNGTQGNPVAWYRNNSGFFDPGGSVLKVRQYAAMAGGANNRYDYVENGNFGYLYVTDASLHTLVRLWRIERPDDSGTSTTPVSYLPSNSTLPLNDWPAQVRVAASYLVPYDAGCTLTVAVDDRARCGKAYPLSAFGP
jgi:hypothetical protein